jgi:hypothetical protein
MSYNEEVKQQEAYFPDCEEKSTPEKSSQQEDFFKKITAKRDPDFCSITDIQIPKYKCIKEVCALKIKSIIFNPDGTAVFVPENVRYAPIELDAEYVRKHNPVEGGYYVVYKDGYKSFSPAHAFEDGYVLTQ